MDKSCATCAQIYDHPLDEKPPLPGRHLYCCGRSICSRCLNSNKRYETYCPYCQITTEPSLLPQGLKDPPAYSTLDERLQHPPPPPSHYNDEGDPPAYTASSRDQPPSKPESDEVPADDVLHFLTPEDSIHSLSLAYGVPANALRRSNNVFSDQLIQGRKTVIIPGEYYKGGVSLSPQPIDGEEEEMRKQKVRRFMVGCKVSDYDVALLYLKQTEWDLEEAVARFQDDEIWEKEHPLQAKQKIKNGKKAKDVGMRRFVGR